MSETEEKLRRKGVCPAQERLKRLQKTLSEEKGREKRNSNSRAKNRPVRRLQSTSSPITKKITASLNSPSAPKPSTSTKTTFPTQKNIGSRSQKPPKNEKVSTKATNSGESQNNLYKRPKISTEKTPDNRRRTVSSTSSKRKLQDRVKQLVESTFGNSNVQAVERRKVEACRDPDLHKVRYLVQNKSIIEAMDVDLCSSSNTYLNRRVEPGASSEHDVNVHIVVDTNVLIDCTGSLKLLKDVKVKSMTPILIVPWQVLKELDYLKEDKTSKLAKRARAAVNFVMDGLTSGDSFVRGQPQEVAAKSDGLAFEIEVPDDHLIKCCLQLLSTGRTAVLLTNDKNLTAKASVSGVIAFSNARLSEIIAEDKKKRSCHAFEIPPEGVSESNDAAAFIHRLTNIFSGFLNDILRKGSMSKYGPMWLWHTPPGTPPWGIVPLMNNTKAYITGVSSQMEIITQFYSRSTSYNCVTMAEASLISHKISELIGPLSANFESETAKLNFDMAFLKCPNPLGPPPGSTFIRESVQLANLHFATFDKNLRTFCHWLSKQFGIPFPLNVEHSEALQFDVGHFDQHLLAAERILGALESLQTISVDQINVETWAIQEINRELRRFLQDLAHEQFQADDLVQFFKCSDLRSALSNAISTLSTIVSYLYQFKG